MWRKLIPSVSFREMPGQSVLVYRKFGSYTTFHFDAVGVDLDEDVIGMK